MSEIHQHDGSRPLPYDRETLGRFVREAWVRWAETQPAPKPSWLVPYEDLSEADKEADRQIGEAVARWTLIGDAARDCFVPAPHDIDKVSANCVSSAPLSDKWKTVLANRISVSLHDERERCASIIEARLSLYTDIGQINALRECINSIRESK